MMKEKVEIKLLETKKPTRLWWDRPERNLILEPEDTLVTSVSGYHLYFLLPKAYPAEGDWCFNLKDPGICRANQKEHEDYLLPGLSYPVYRNDRLVKVVASSDPSLEYELDEGIKSIFRRKGYDTNHEFLPQPPEIFYRTFVKEYNNGNFIDAALIECLVSLGFSSFSYFDHYFPNITEDNKVVMGKNDTVMRGTGNSMKTNHQVASLIMKVLRDASEAGYFEMETFREKADFENDWLEKNI